MMDPAIRHLVALAAVVTALVWLALLPPRGRAPTAVERALGVVVVVFGSGVGFAVLVHSNARGLPSRQLLLPALVGSVAVLRSKHRAGAWGVVAGALVAGFWLGLGYMRLVSGDYVGQGDPGRGRGGTPCSPDSTRRRRRRIIDHPALSGD